MRQDQIPWLQFQGTHLGQMPSHCIPNFLRIASDRGSSGCALAQPNAATSSSDAGFPNPGARFWSAPFPFGIGVEVGNAFPVSAGAGSGIAAVSGGNNVPGASGSLIFTDTPGISG